MAPLPQNNTGRLWVDYLANSRQHTIMFRFGGAGLPTVTFQDGVNDFFEVNGFIMPTDWTFLGARVAVAGSDISNPFALGVTPFSGDVTPNLAEAPAYVSYVGRSSTGRRGRLFLLGAGLSPAGDTGIYNNYRATTAESAAVQTVINVLNAFDPLAIDGNAIVWNNYANLGYHSYWQKELRG